MNKAEKKLQEHKKEQVKSKKKMCCILIIGVIILAIVAIPVALKSNFYFKIIIFNFIFNLIQ